MDKTVIKFDHALIPLIQEGTKTLTYRVGDTYSFLDVGDGNRDIPDDERILVLGFKVKELKS